MFNINVWCGCKGFFVDLKVYISTNRHFMERQQIQKCTLYNNLITVKDPVLDMQKFRVGTLWWQVFVSGLGQKTKCFVCLPQLLQTLLSLLVYLSFYLFHSSPSLTTGFLFLQDGGESTSHMCKLQESLNEEWKDKLHTGVSVITATYYCWKNLSIMDINEPKLLKLKTGSHHHLGTLYQLLTPGATRRLLSIYNII